MQRWLPALPWHCLVLPAPLAAVKQQMHLLGQMTHCRIQARIPVPHSSSSGARVGQEFKGSCWGWLGCRAGSCTSPSSLSQPASKPPWLVCPVLLFLEFLAQHPKTIPAPRNNLSSHKQPRGGAGLVPCSSCSSQQGMEAPSPSWSRCVQGWAGFSTLSKLKQSEVLRLTCRMGRSSSREHVRNKM